MGIIDRHERTYVCDFPGCSESHCTAHDMGDQGFRVVNVDAGDATQLYKAVLCERHVRLVHQKLRELYGFEAVRR